ncbi:MAG: pitrilysin family protein [Patescibacteria group bacterium]|jgi:predicted Zn-dependent peptidase
MFKQEKLANGIQLITAHRADTQAVTVLVLVKIGSRYESLDLNGVSHFVEHLLFKGTRKRPNSLAISRALDGIGAEYNAFTAKDHTGYYIKANSEHLDLALDMLSDMFFNSVFDAREMDKERGVIVEEINMYNDNPLMLINDIFEETVFAGHSLGRRISGPKENILKKISTPGLVKFYRDHYLNNQIIVGVAGNFNEDSIIKKIGGYFNKPLASHKGHSFAKFSSTQKSPRVNLHFKDTSQVQLALGFPGFKNTDPRVYALSLLAVILGGNMSSRLFTEIREKRGLAYFVRASDSFYEDCGNFVIQAGVELNSLEKAIKTILDQLKKVTKQPVGEAELKRAKEFLKGKFVLQLEDSAALISWLGEQKLLTGRLETVQEKLAKINRVTAQEIKKVAAEVINLAKINLALIGPFKDKEKFLKLLK